MTGSVEFVVEWSSLLGTQFRSDGHGAISDARRVAMALPPGTTYRITRVVTQRQLVMSGEVPR